MTIGTNIYMARGRDTFLVQGERVGIAHVATESGTSVGGGVIVIFQGIKDTEPQETDPFVLMDPQALAQFVVDLIANGVMAFGPIPMFAVADALERLRQGPDG